jgi:hypothetical protein
MTNRTIARAANIQFEFFVKKDVWNVFKRLSFYSNYETKWTLKYHVPFLFIFCILVLSRNKWNETFIHKSRLRVARVKKTGLKLNIYKLKKIFICKLTYLISNPFWFGVKLVKMMTFYRNIIGGRQRDHQVFLDCPSHTGCFYFRLSDMLLISANTLGPFNTKLCISEII